MIEAFVTTVFLTAVPLQLLPRYVRNVADPFAKRLTFIVEAPLSIIKQVPSARNAAPDSSFLQFAPDS